MIVVVELETMVRFGSEMVRNAGVAASHVHDHLSSTRSDLVQFLDDSVARNGRWVVRCKVSFALGVVFMPELRIATKRRMQRVGTHPLVRFVQRTDWGRVWVGAMRKMMGRLIAWSGIGWNFLRRDEFLRHGLLFLDLGFELRGRWGWEVRVWCLSRTAF